ncbi:MAG: hypothetical protein HN980_01705 [Waddliaceae bacterium]|nr:hypothetical protein [Waddliaceae bacterium]
MIRALFFSIIATTTFVVMPSFVAADEDIIVAEDVIVAEDEHYSQDLEMFTGKVTGDRVRMRVKPTLIDSTIIREFNRSDLVLIDGEVDGFYAVTPPKEMKAYIFRTYVLDGVVEGTGINVRLAPDVEAPIVAQLNTGDTVDGHISDISNKWLEITSPESVRFYIAKEYVTNAGDENYITMMAGRGQEAEQALSTAALTGESEINKPFEEISIERVKQGFEDIIISYNDFPEQVEKAQEALALVQEAYLQKKVAFLETRTQKTAEELRAKGEKLAEGIKQFAGDENLDIVTVSEGVDVNTEALFEMHLVSGNETIMLDMTDKMRIWTPKEQALYESWKTDNEDKNIVEFYEEQKIDAKKITGILEPYSAVVKNKPGDFVVLKHGIPVAYIYSTNVDLQEKVGKEVAVIGLERSNNDFAFPAYFAVSIE